MFSSVVVWMVKSLAGVQQADDAFPPVGVAALASSQHHQQQQQQQPFTNDVTVPASGNAFSHLRLQPRVPKGLGGVNYTFNSPRGRVESNWTVSLSSSSPAADATAVAATAAGLTFEWTVRVPVNVQAEVLLPDGKPSFSVGSGVHHFTAQLPAANGSVV